MLKYIKTLGLAASISFPLEAMQYLLKPNYPKNKHHSVRRSRLAAWKGTIEMTSHPNSSGKVY
jgi:hypothetical protein